MMSLENTGCLPPSTHASLVCEEKGIGQGVLRARLTSGVVSEQFTSCCSALGIPRGARLPHSFIMATT